MHQRAGLKLHHGWMPNAPMGGLLLAATPPLTHFVTRVMLIRHWPCRGKSALPGFYFGIKPEFGCRSAQLLVAGAGVACSV